MILLRVEAFPGYSHSEDTHTLRFASELAELRVGYADRIPPRYAVGARCEARVAARANPEKKKSTHRRAADAYKKPKPRGVNLGVVWSCYPDSDRGPHPYQGCALPAEP